MDDPLGVDPLGALEAPEPASAPVAAPPVAEPAPPIVEPEPEPEPVQAPPPVDAPPKMVKVWVDGSNVDPQILADKKIRIQVQGYGEGVVQEFKKAMFGASQHVVAFDNPQHGVAKVTLERHGNGKTPFKVQVEKEAPKPKAATKASPKTRAKERRGFQTFSEQTSEAAAGGDGSAVDRFREAIKAGDFATVQSLLTQVELNQQDKLGNTSLHQAALFDQSEMIQLFMEQGASVDITNNIGETPITIAKPFMQQKMQGYVDAGAW